MDVFFYSHRTDLIVNAGPLQHIPVQSSEICDRIIRTGLLSADELYRVQQAIAGQVQHRISLLRRRATEGYHAYNPDRQSLRFRDHGQSPARELQFVQATEQLMTLAGFQHLDPMSIKHSLHQVSPFGLNLNIHLRDFELLRIYTRDQALRLEWRRDWRRLFLARTRLQVPVYRRLVLIFKLKCRDHLIRDRMILCGQSYRTAARFVQRYYRHLPQTGFDQYIYLKLFKDTPQDDIEMLLPNRGVRMKLFDKIKLGLSGTGSITAGIYAAIKKLLFTTFNPMTLVITLGTLGGAIVQQITKYLAQRNTYLRYLSEALYFHTLAGNRSVISHIGEQAADELTKQTLLVYFIIRRSGITPDAPALQQQARTLLCDWFGVDVTVDPHAALTLLQTVRLESKVSEPVQIDDTD